MMAAIPVASYCPNSAPIRRQYPLTALVLLVSLVAGLLAIAAQAQPASDVAKEQRWAEQVVDTLFDGEPLWLNADGHEFLGIHMTAENGSRQNGLLVIHGMGVHPNWDQVVRPLRVGLAEEGWQTLSIQMPVLANEAAARDYAALFPEAGDRIIAAVEALQARGASNIAVVAHSMGAAMTSFSLAEQQELPVAAVVLIGVNAAPDSMPVDVARQLQQIRIPVLDIYGSNDLPGVLSSVPVRANAAQSAGNTNYLQVEVDGANHFFDGAEAQLLEQVGSWLSLIAE